MAVVNGSQGERKLHGVSVGTTGAKHRQIKNEPVRVRIQDAP